MYTFKTKLQAIEFEIQIFYLKIEIIYKTHNLKI